MIKKIKIEIQEERKKRTYKHSFEVKAGSMSQNKLKEFVDRLLETLEDFGLLEEEEEE